MRRIRLAKLRLFCYAVTKKAKEDTDMPNIPVISFVAYSGTGKTTLIEKLVAELKARGLRVAVIKHDAHDFDVDKSGKDTWRFTQAGADVVAIVNATHAAVMENRPVTFEDLVAKITDVDIIITEGWKTGDVPKIALRRAATGNGFPEDLTNVVAFISDTPVESELPRFDFTDVSEIADFICRN
ncbi:MAG: molybdopterin-guanine dinucleotide biosynthesis protein B [Oscillospiraceae bacterium]|jgi:molybdopterin-guanine dinucleotide biosynthesis protein B|nr:molybdopterin-guanine dinucleotide biosynthesis protein B [Oscillospiraceae bacterium]